MLLPVGFFFGLFQVETEAFLNSVSSLFSFMFFATAEYRLRQIQAGSREEVEFFIPPKQTCSVKKQQNQTKYCASWHRYD